MLVDRRPAILPQHALPLTMRGRSFERFFNQHGNLRGIRIGREERHILRQQSTQRLDVAAKRRQPVHRGFDQWQAKSLAIAGEKQGIREPVEGGEFTVPYGEVFENEDVAAEAILERALAVLAEIYCRV